MLPVNEVLKQGRFRILNQFEQDATGVVYKAYDNVLRTNVMLKESFVNLGKAPTVTQVEQSRLDFADEARVLTEIKHDTLLHVQDYFTETDRYFLVTEFVEGDSLSELLVKRNGPFALSEAAEWADRLLDALEYLHSRMPPLVHGNIKPQNVRLTAGNQIKLVAPCVVKSSDGNKGGALADPGFDFANLHYLPLEQIWEGLDPASQRVIINSCDEKREKSLKEPIDSRSDIYALGATLYFLVTARQPIDALERSIAMLEGKADPLRPPKHLNPEIPQAVSDALIKAMAIQRGDRFQTAAALRRELSVALTQLRSKPVREESAPEIGRADEAASQMLPIVPAPPKTENKKAAETKERPAELVVPAEPVQPPADEKRAEPILVLTEAETEPVVEAPPEPRPMVRDTSDDFGVLFAEAPKDNKNFKVMAIAVLLVAVIVGGVWGYLNFVDARPAPSGQPAAEQSKPADHTTQPSTTVNSAVPQTDAAPAGEANADPAPASEVESKEAPAANTAVRSRSDGPPRKHTTAPAPKPKEPKKVTLEDLLK